MDFLDICLVVRLFSQCWPVFTHLPITFWSQFLNIRFPRNISIDEVFYHLSAIHWHRKLLSSARVFVSSEGKENHKSSVHRTIYVPKLKAMTFPSIYTLLLLLLYLLSLLSQRSVCVCFFFVFLTFIFPFEFLLFH